jgi:hypothetical protein
MSSARVSTHHAPETEVTMPTSLTMNDVLERLAAIAEATNGGARGATVLTCDILHQDALYRLQGNLVALMADVANAAGPVAARRLMGRFPTVFERV